MKQKVISGLNSINKLPEILKERDVKSVFFVTGKSSFVTCGASQKIKELSQGFECTFFDDFSVNPTFQEARRGATEFCNSKATAIVAIGGGSAIDLAKSVAVFSVHKGKEKELVKGNLEIKNTIPLLICIPTTSGTGSESTHFAVIYLGGKKYSLASPNLLPVVALLDAQFTFNLPTYITACSVFDALSQAVESYWSISATSDSKTLAKKAIEIILKNLPILIEKNNKESRVNLLYAANLAGQAINITKTTAPHALSYILTSDYGIPHGHAVALILHRFFPLHENLMISEVARTLSYVKFMESFNDILVMFNAKSGHQAQEMWLKLMSICGLEHDITKFGIVSEDDHIKIVKGVNLERLKNHPVNLSEARLLSLFI